MKFLLIFSLIIIVDLSYSQVNQTWEDNDWMGVWVIEGDWEVGIPGVGPSSAIQGINCAGTILNGNYEDEGESRLTSPLFIVPDTSENPHLRFWQWYDFSYSDRGSILIKKENGDWDILSEPFQWNSSNVWSSPIIDLSAYAGQSVQVAFQFSADDSNSASNDISSGWYIDDIELVTGPIIFNHFEDFENDMGHWSAEGPWELGTPTSGPESSYSGIKCFGTNLNGNYSQPPSSVQPELINLLISPLFTVPDASENPYLRFWQWYDFSYGDSGSILIKKENGDWDILSEPFQWNSSNVWSSPIIDLFAYAGQSVQVAFQFVADNFSNATNDVSSGWYIDNIELVAGPIIFNHFEDFENDIGHWSAEGPWELGTPTFGPESSYSGNNCCGTNLSGNYSQPLSSLQQELSNLLTSPTFTVPDASENPHLRFWQWYDFSYSDSGSILIKNENGDWDILSESFQWNSSNVWSSPIFDLSAYAGQSVQVAFHFVADNFSNATNDVSSGWYIDDIELVTGPVIFNDFEDFENDIGHWSAEGPWELGAPTFGPESSYSGNNCFGTNLNGNYSQPPSSLQPELINLLISPSFIVSDSSSYPRLRFRHWYDFAQDDYGEVLFRVVGEPWEVVLGSFSGTSENDWKRPFLDLMPYIGKKVQVAFRLLTKDSTNSSSDVSSGWYIDDFNLQNFSTLPLPEIRLEKSGTTPVPGREVEYFISLENLGETTIDSMEISELLEPWFIFIDASPYPNNIVQSIDIFPFDSLGNNYDSFLEWTVSSLSPGEMKIISYKVLLENQFDVGDTVRGSACPRAEMCQNQYYDCANIFVAQGCLSAGTQDEIEECMKIRQSFCSGQWKACHNSLFVDIRFNGGSCAEDKKEAQGPFDPNEKVVLAEKYIQQNQTLVYPIHFENIGTVEAIDVFVTDTLDTNLDLSSLEILTPEGVSIDTANRVVKWELLDRNLQPGETDNVLLSISPNSNLPSGTEIRNTAEIQFDIFDPFLTNEVINIIDDQRPVSQMNQLPPITPDTTFSISWMGIDSIGEIDNYSIFVSVDGSEYTEHFLRLEDTTAIFSGDIGKTYSFISIAEDVAGNIEEKLPIAEATTYVDPTVSVISTETNNTENSQLLKQNFPNPFNISTSIEYSIIKTGKVKLDIYDIYGSKVISLVEKNQNEGNYIVNWDGRNSLGVKSEAGMYLYRLVIDDYLEVKKMVLVK